MRGMEVINNIGNVGVGWTYKVMGYFLPHL